MYLRVRTGLHADSFAFSPRFRTSPRLGCNALLAFSLSLPLIETVQLSFRNLDEFDNKVILKCLKLIKFWINDNKRTEVRAFACLAGSREQCRPCMSHTAEDKCSSRSRKNARAKNIYSALGSTTQAKNSSPVKCQRTEVSQVS